MSDTAAAVSATTTAADTRASFLDQIESIDMGDDGNLVIETVKPADPPAATPAAAPVAAPAAAPAAQTPPADSWESRYKELQSAFTRSTQELRDRDTQLDTLKTTVATLSGKLEALLAGKQPAAAPAKSADADLEALVQDPYALLSEPKKLLAVIEKVATKKAEEMLGGVTQRVEPMITEFQVQQEFKEGFVKYGSEFLDNLPMVQQVIEQMNDPNLTMVRAFELAKGLLGTQKAPDQNQEGKATDTGAPAPPAAPAPVPPAAPSVDPAAAAARATRLAAVSAGADTGRVGSASEPRKEAKSIRDAFDAAIEEALK